MALHQNISSSELLGIIRSKIAEYRGKPTKVYMSLAHAAVLCDDMHVVCRCVGGLRSGFQIYGLRVKVHDDFDLPEVI